MRKLDRKRLTLTRETLKSLEENLHLVAAGSETVIVGCIPRTQGICPITTTF